MGSRSDQSALRARSITAKSDSGYGDDVSESARDKDPDAESHPLTRKGYEIGPASNLQVGDVFEFLWADAHEFEWEWKCLGYTRFIVLRHSDTFPHHCVCIPISVGCKPEFAKPGIDSSQQGFVVAEGDRDRDRDRDRERDRERDRNSTYDANPSDGASSSSRLSTRLPFSPIAVELRPGKLRVKDDSRANYADIVEIDHDAQVMVVGSVDRYFDRVRRNVNKAYMRLILRKALEEYKSGRAGGKLPLNSDARPSEEQDRNDETHEDDGHGGAVVNPAKYDRESMWGEAAKRDTSPPKKVVPKECSAEDAAAYEDRARKQRAVRRENTLPYSSRSSHGGSRLSLVRETTGDDSVDYDSRSMHNVALAGRGFK